MTEPIGSIIAGDSRPGEQLTPSLNPSRDGEVVATAALGDAELTAEAIAAANAAAVDWGRRPAAQRGEILHRTSALLAERSREIGADLAAEEGKTLAEGVAETMRASEVMRYFAAQTLEPDGTTLPSASPTTTLIARRVPLGTVAVITPWNFPIAIPAWKMAPALAYGNAVVWKPAGLVPLTSLHLMRAMSDAGMPDGVVNMLLVPGGGASAALATDCRVDALTFTGSNAVGEALRRDAAASGKPVQLELGGKNPAIVLADADLEHAADTIARAAFMSAGQKCTATSRVIVESSISERFAELLAERADAMVVGDALDPSVQVGPLSSAAAAESVRAYLRDAERDGRRLTQREPGLTDEGCFVAPAVYADLPAEHPASAEEIFGPVVSLLEAADYEEAVELANATPFGLVSSLFTSDLAAALRFADDVDTGVVKINQETSGVELQAPFGGAKASGSGPQEQGKAAVEFFTHWKTIYLDRVVA